jgi:hypothetical protein
MTPDDANDRKTALAKLRRAQRMIAEGRAELSAAHKKIEAAQKAIDESAAVLRATWSRRKNK